MNTSVHITRYFFHYNSEWPNPARSSSLAWGSLHDAVLEHGNFLNTDILKGRAVMCLQYDGIFNDYFTANLPVNLSVKKI